MRFDIAPAALDEVLREFERATGWKVEIPDAGMRSLPFQRCLRRITRAAGPAPDSVWHRPHL